MIPLRTFLDTVASVVTTLDVIEQCLVTAMETVMAEGVRDPAGYEILCKMERSDLVCFDRDGWDAVVAITPKGRALAADIRRLTEKTGVKP